MILAGGQVIPLNMGPFSGADNGISSFGGGGYPTSMQQNQGAQASTVGNTPSAHAAGNYTPPAPYLWVMLILVIMLACARGALQRGDRRDQFSLVGIGVYNLVAITLMAGVGITTAKIIANKYALVPVVTDIVNTW